MKLFCWVSGPFIFDRASWEIFVQNILLKRFVDTTFGVPTFRDENKRKKNVLYI